MSQANQSNRRERRIYSTSLHWVIFSESIGILLLGFFISFLGARYREFLGSMTMIIEYLSLFVLIFGGGKFLIELIRLRTSEFLITSDRVIIKVGVIQRSSTSMPLSKIESIEIDQSILGRLLGFGSIQITGTGTAESKFDYLNNPHKFRRKMQLISGMASDEDRQQEISNTQYRRRRRRPRR